MKTNYLKSVKLVIILFFLFCFGLFSCQSNSNTETETQEIRIAEEKQYMEVTFMVSNVEDDINGTQSTITATINDKKIEVTKATNCNLVEKEEYESKDIPDEATWACTCWWAGAGKDFYAKKGDTTVTFYQKEVYEDMKTEDEKWELLKTLE
jgi:hypothetical protein